MDEVSDQEMFNEAIAKEPIAEAKAEAKPDEGKEAEVKAERERDEKGRFKSAKDDNGGDESPPAAEATLEAPKVEQKEPEVHNIPSWRLKEEADAKREAIERATRAEQEAQAFRQQLWQMQQQLQALQQPREPIDIFADPQAYQQTIEQTMSERLRAMEGNFSLRLAAYKHGDTFHEAWAEMVNRSQTGDDALRQQVLQSPDPGETLVQLYQREKVVKEVGTDPTAYRSKVLDEALKDPEFLAKALEQARASAGAQPTQQISMPKSLNKVAAAASAGGSDDMSDNGLYHYATR